MDYEDELDLLSVVAVTQIDAEGKAHLDFHCNEYGTLLKSIALVESWDVVSRVHGIQSCKTFLYRWHLLEQMLLCSCQSRFTYTSDHMEEVIILHAGQNEYFFRLSPLGSRGCLLTNGFKDKALCFFHETCCLLPYHSLVFSHFISLVMFLKIKIHCIESPQLFNRDKSKHVRFLSTLGSVCLLF